MSIRISPKHGANPTIPVCLYCGKDKGEVLIYGKVDKQDSKMPMHTITDAVPCENCQKLWQNGVALIRACDREHPNMVKVTAQNGQNVWLDGSTMLVKEEFAQRIFNVPMKKGDPVYLEDKVFDQLMKKWDDYQKKNGQTTETEQEANGDVGTHRVN